MQGNIIPKKLIHCTIAGLLILQSLGWTSDEHHHKPYLAALHFLAVNRSLITQLESEYTRLTELEAFLPSMEITKQIVTIKYKLQALKDDSERLQSELPKNIRADEFMKDLLARLTAAQAKQKATKEFIETYNKKVMDVHMKEIYALHENALREVARKNYGKACKLYEEIILLDPDDDEAYLLLGHCRLILADYEKAKEAFMNAIHIDAANADEITKLYKNVILENPQDDEAYAHLGFAYWILENQKAAEEAFRNALEINPRNEEARVVLSALASAAQ